MRVSARAPLCLLLVSLAGCGGGTKTVTVSATKTATSATGTTPAGTTTSAAASTPLATRAGLMDNHPVTLSIVALKRSGATVELTLSVSTSSATEVQVAETFDDGNNQNVAGGGVTAGEFTLDGIFLLDTTNSKKYPVGRDSNQQCLCDVNLNDTTVTNAAPLFLSATFGAPPAGVNAVNVFIPHFGTFASVPTS